VCSSDLEKTVEIIQDNLAYSFAVQYCSDSRLTIPFYTPKKLKRISLSVNRSLSAFILLYIFKFTSFEGIGTKGAFSYFKEDSNQTFKDPSLRDPTTLFEGRGLGSSLGGGMDRQPIMSPFFGVLFSPISLSVQYAVFKRVLNSLSLLTFEWSLERTVEARRRHYKRLMLHHLLRRNVRGMTDELKIDFKKFAEEEDERTRFLELRDDITEIESNEFNPKFDPNETVASLSHFYPISPTRGEDMSRDKLTFIKDWFQEMNDSIVKLKRFLKDEKDIKNLLNLDDIEEIEMDDLYYLNVVDELEDLDDLTRLDWASLEGFEQEEEKEEEKEDKLFLEKIIDEDVEKLEELLINKGVIYL
jgi:hypothetical protein